MEVITKFCKQHNKQLQDIFLKECSNGSNNHIILINYTKLDDIKVSCVEIQTIEKQILTDLENIKNKSNDISNENYAIVINTELSSPINIVKYKVKFSKSLALFKFFCYVIYI